MKTRRLIVVLALAVALAGCERPGERSPAREAVAAKEWHSLVIGQTLAVGESTVIMRVPGGWILQATVGWSKPMCFIPYSDEGAEK